MVLVNNTRNDGNNRINRKSLNKIKIKFGNFKRLTEAAQRNFAI